MPTPNPTSAPAPQEQPDYSYKPTATEAWLVKDAEALAIQKKYGCPYNAMIGIFCVAELLEAYAKADRLKLAEEAEREARELREAGARIHRNPFGSEYEASTVRARIVEGAAAWLREKAQ